MPKKINITQKQLEEAIDIFVNKRGSENPEQALRRTKKETEREVGSFKDVNYVVSSDQMKESRVFTKKEILEARHKYLKENSSQFTKENFISKYEKEKNIHNGRCC